MIGCIALVRVYQGEDGWLPVDRHHPPPFDLYQSLCNEDNVNYMIPQFNIKQLKQNITVSI